MPTISLYEVFKRILQQRDENAALQAVAVMQQGAVVGLSDDLALRSAALSVRLRLPMADSVVLATAHSTEAPYGPRI